MRNGRDALVQWQKVVNSYRLRVLIELSKKALPMRSEYKTQFAAIVTNPANIPFSPAMLITCSMFITAPIIIILIIQPTMVTMQAV